MNFQSSLRKTWRFLIFCTVCALLLAVAVSIVSNHLGHHHHHGNEVIPSHNNSTSTMAELDEQDYGHGHDKTMTSEHSMSHTGSMGVAEHSYSQLNDKFLLWLHIIFMTISFGILFPIGVMLGIARSYYHKFCQLAGTLIAGFGFYFGAKFSHASPELYAHNFHGKLGWILFLLMVVQMVLGMIRVVFGATNLNRNQETRGFQPLKEPLDGFENTLEETDEEGAMLDSPVSTHSETTLFGSGRRSTSTRSEHSIDIGAAAAVSVSRLSLLQPDLISRLRAGILDGVPDIVLHIGSDPIFRYVHAILGTSFILLAYAQFIIGAITFSGTCQDEALGNCLAHYIKGSIFFWYGVVVFLQYLGCFWTVGWAWNIVPPQSAKSKNRITRFLSSVPFSFIESFVIFLYGITNTFLEHTGKDPSWTHRDFQHASLAFMWWWGGILGILLDSQPVKRVLTSFHSFQEIDKTSLTISRLRNPVPALVLIVTGISMGNHHQNSEFSSAVHRQFGGFLVLAGIFRLMTVYMTSKTRNNNNKDMTGREKYLASRPPTEILASFCIIAAGITLMVANKSMIRVMNEIYGLDSNFMMNLVVSMTFFVLVITLFLVIVLKSSGKNF